MSLTLRKPDAKGRGRSGNPTFLNFSCHFCHSWKHKKIAANPAWEFNVSVFRFAGPDPALLGADTDGGAEEALFIFPRCYSDSTVKGLGRSGHSLLDVMPFYWRDQA